MWLADQHGSTANAKPSDVSHACRAIAGSCLDVGTKYIDLLRAAGTLESHTSAINSTATYIEQL